LSDDERPDPSPASGEPRPDTEGSNLNPSAPWERPWAMTPRPAAPAPAPSQPDNPASDRAEATADTSVAAVLQRVGGAALSGRRRRREDDTETAVLPRITTSSPPPDAGEAPPTQVSAPASPVITASPRPTRLQTKRQHRRRRATVLRRGTAAFVALLVFLVTGAAWGATTYLDSKLNHVDALDQNSASVHNPSGQRGDENYLLVGSDSRAGSNGEVGAGGTAQAGGARSDTVMLAHVPADRGRVVVVSFPRDLEVDRPACAEWHNSDATYSTTTAPAETQSKLNAAYSVGGPRCLVQVIQQISGLKINHFVGVDFSGFESLVNQIGGVEVCTTRPLVDNELGTILPNAGTQLINGQTALSYVRARKVDAEGTGDYGRIKRQQRFLSSLLRKAMSTDVLFNFGKLRGFINGFTATTFGQNMDADSLITLGQSLQGLSAGRVTFITVPTTGTRDGNEVPNLKEITNIFQAIIDDTPLPGEQGAAKPAPTPPPTTTPSKPGGSAQIRVLNATTKAGLAGTTAQKLSDFGYTMDTVGSGTSTQRNTSIRYSAPQADAAKQLGASVPDAQLQEVDDLGDTIELVLGQSFGGDVLAPSAAPTSSAPAPLPPGLSVVNAGDASCG